MTAIGAFFIDGPCAGQLLTVQGPIVSCLQFDGYNADGSTRTKTITYYRTGGPLPSGRWAYTVKPPRERT